MSTKKPVLGHSSFETAFIIDNYPWGFKLRTKMYVWIETTPKKGDRIVRQTINPKTGSLCAPKASTYNAIGYLFLDEKGHIKWTAVHQFDQPEQVKAFGEAMGLENMNHEQRKQYNALLGIHEKKVDEFTGAVKKDFSVKWETEIIGAGWKDGKYNKGEKGKCNEVKITFDRPDGVTLKEIFKAMKTLNQEKLNQVFEMRESRTFGSYPGTVRICVRGGMQLGTVSESDYKNYLASDVNVTEEEAATA